MALISVVMPAYNYREYIRTAIQSVLRQENAEKLELIVIDDGSTDDTLTILNEFGDRIEFYHQNNKGASAARNLGIEKSRGEYIAFLDADDLLTPGSISSRYMYLKKHPECQWVYGNWKYATADLMPIATADERILPPLNQRSGNIFPTLLKNVNFICSFAPMIKKSRLEEVGGFDPNLPACQDYELWLRLSKRWHIAYINDIVAVQRIHKSHISSNPEKRYTSQIKILKSYWKDPEGRAILRPVYYQRLSNIYNYLAIITAGKNSSRLSLKYCLMSALYKPKQLMAYKLLLKVALRDDKGIKSNMENYMVSLFEKGR